MTWMGNQISQCKFYLILRDNFPVYKTYWIKYSCHSQTIKSLDVQWVSRIEKPIKYETEMILAEIEPT